MSSDSASPVLSEVSDSWRRACAGTCVLLLMMLVSTTLASAETRNVFFRRISLEQGLPAATVHQMTQDRQGFLWLATPDGLSQYDGYTFTVYRHDPEQPASLPNNDVRTVLETSAGELLVGTDGGGLGRLDRATGFFSPIDLGVESERLRIRSVLESEDGTVWIGTEGRGLIELDLRNGTFTVVPLARANDIEPISVTDLYRDQVGLLWIATANRGLIALDPDSGLVDAYRQLPDDDHSLSSDQLRSVTEDRDGSIWVGTRGSGLNRLDRRTGHVERYFDSEEVGRARTIRSLYVDAGGTLWVGSGGGLYEWQPGTEEFLAYRHNPADPWSLSSDDVTTVFQDRGRVLWIGTYNGLNSWNTSSGSFLHRLRDHYVTSFAEDREGNFWIGTMAGLKTFRRASDEIEGWRIESADYPELPDDRVMSLRVDRGDRVWIGTRNGGLSRFDPRTGETRHFRHGEDDPSSIGADGIISILEDRDGTIWVGAYGGGLNRFNEATNDFTRFRHDPDDPRSLSSDRVTSLFEDQDGVLWVGTEQSGINRFDRSTGRCRRFFHKPDDARSLSSDHAWFVTGDERGNLWIGTDEAGLNQWRADDRTAGREVFERYSTLDGLARNIVYAIVPDRHGDVWVSSNGGLARLTPETREITNFNVSNGLQNDEFNHNAGYRSRQGELFFGGINGFNRFYPERIRPAPYSPPVVLTSFEKFNRPVAFDGVVSDVDEIPLDYQDSVIAFRFSALDFTAPDKNRYRYRLDGFDEGWIEAGGTRLATYTNLDAGEYVFRVRGSNSDAVWSENELAVRLTVAPPPWRTWWAYLLYAVAATSLVAGVLLAFARKRRRAAELERINISLEREVREREAKEKALEAEKKKAREYLDVAEVIMLALSTEGNVALINQKGCRILGRPEQDIVGRDWVSSFVPERERQGVRKKLSETGSSRSYEYPIVTADGDERVVAWHSAMIPASTEAPAVILSSGADITQVRQLEKQVRLHQKMDALGTLAGGIAHDFNNILTAIFGYSTLTLGQVPPGSEEAEYLGNVIRACDRAKDLVSRILTFSRGGEQDKRPIDVGEIVLEGCELLRSSLPATIDVQTVVAPDCLPVMGDPTQIHQVVMNLGTNAGHAMPEGGVLEVAVASAQVDGGVERGDGSRRGPHVTITVRDTGHGMDAELVEKIFDPFFTTKKVGEGTGLGLSVVHGIVRSHGGDVNVESGVGEGTCFVVRLPCTQAVVGGKAEEARASAGSERILVVDDERLICTLAQKILENLGYVVSATTEPERALEWFRAQPNEYDLLLTDQMMPGMTGLDLVSQLRELDPGLPVVVASGRRTEELVRDDLEFLQKPFKVAEIGDAVRRALDRRPRIPKVAG